MRSWEQTLVWLIANDVGHLVVWRAQELCRTRWTWLCQLAAGANLDLWLIAQGHSLVRTQREAARDWLLQPVEFEAFQNRFRATARMASDDEAKAKREAKRTSQDSGSRPDFPAVPSEEFVLLPARCRELLSDEDLATVEQAWRRARTVAREWLTESSQRSEQETADFIRSIAVSACSADERVVRLRATQHELFLSGYLLKVRPELLDEAAESDQVPLDDAAVSALAPYACVRHAGLAMLALAGDLPTAELSRLPLKGVAPDCSRVGSVEIPFAARPILRAVIITRYLEGADKDQPLFPKYKRIGGIDRIANGPATPSMISSLMGAVAQETGLQLRATQKSKETPVSWRARHGVSFQPLRSKAAS